MVASALGGHIKQISGLAPAGTKYLGEPLGKTCGICADAANATCKRIKQN
jgi:hypothetical protein